MAVNLIDSTDIEITQTGDNIQLSTTVDMQTLESNVSTNTSDIENLQNGNVYSTNEVNTGKVWINNKPIYRKVIEITSPSLSATTDYNHGIENVDILRPVEMFVIRNSDNTVRPINIAYSSSTVISQGTRTKISYRIPADIWNWVLQPSDLTLYIIVEYTKTTD